MRAVAIYVCILKKTFSLFFSPLSPLQIYTHTHIHNPSIFLCLLYTNICFSGKIPWIQFEKPVRNVTKTWNGEHRWSMYALMQGMKSSLAASWIAFYRYVGMCVCMYVLTHIMTIPGSELGGSNNYYTLLAITNKYTAEREGGGKERGRALYLLIYVCTWVSIHRCI